MEIQIKSMKIKVKYYKPIINFPDLQPRILQNSPKINWDNKVHEVLMGHSTWATLPLEDDYCLYHPKHIERQERQNNLYDLL